MFGIDPLYWMLMLPVMLLSFFASFRVKSAFKKYSQVRTAFGITGAQAARQILDRNGLGHVEVVETHGFLSDHYDPTKKVVRLSPEVYRSPSLASVGIAAHETGHAVQHAKSYAPLMLRNMMVPVASIGSNFAWIAIMAGFVIGLMGLVKIGILLFSAVVVFQLLTLPVEFNASAKAKEMLTGYGLVSTGELAGVNKVLSAAAMTYVAAAASAIVTLLYFLLRAGLIGGRDD
ncbi:MAG TPA: zinc metallopeptidase [Acidobacteriota bacterium]|nr:zinc metallopeptidase [Acidobacteriota bacterium]HOT00749.1 zinc metallopeptidase [Acidobacteriota bacterium]HQF87249.1 zinc metallopeptidase [Acidobacteriota bacterium]HQG91823.1 zinc metallopeptidase [Acidobacteriota bacterium]HQK88170.1 zinc metallopeptidase [Acidobacteriota bacterium]